MKRYYRIRTVIEYVYYILTAILCIFLLTKFLCGLILSLSITDYICMFIGYVFVGYWCCIGLRLLTIRLRKKYVNHIM